MTAVLLERVDIALWSDIAGTRLVLNRVQAVTPTDEFEQTLVRFEGDQLATGFRGEGLGRQYEFVARFMSDEHSTMAALEELFRTAQYVDPDGRLWLRTHVGLVSGLDDVQAVMVPSYVRRQVDAEVWDVAFTAKVANSTPAV